MLRMTANDRAMTPMQRFVLNRLAELNLTYRGAADRSEGLVSFGTINQIATGRHTGRLTPRAQRGLALALDVPLGKIEQVYAESQDAPAAMYRLPERANQLSPKQFKALLAVMDGFLEQRATQIKLSAQGSTVREAQVVDLPRPPRSPRPRKRL
jgi:hypothetical protein